MKTEFFHSRIRESARSRMSEVMASGSSRLIGAFCYVTQAGAKLISENIQRFTKEGSFFVAGFNSTTDVAALKGIYPRMKGHLFLHGIASNGTEKPEGDVEPGLMHDKVIYAEDGDKCTLWVGSHNLTNNALNGVNIEAALIITGNKNESVFLDALKHLHSIKAESIDCDLVEVPPPPEGEGHRQLEKIRDLVTVHCSLDPDTLEEVRGKASPFYIKIALKQSDYDTLCIPPPKPKKHVQLLMYDPADLSPNGPAPGKKFTYERRGEIVGVAFTKKSKRHGNAEAVEWNDISFDVNEPEAENEEHVPRKMYWPLILKKSFLNPEEKSQNLDNCTVCLVRIDLALEEKDKANYSDICTLIEKPELKAKVEKKLLRLENDPVSGRSRRIYLIQKRTNFYTQSYAPGCSPTPTKTLDASTNETDGEQVHPVPFRFIHASTSYGCKINEVQKVP